MMRSILLSMLLGVNFVYGRLSTEPLPAQYAEVGIELRDTCLKKLGLSMDEYEKFTFDGNRNMKCYVGCVFEVAGWMASDGTMQFKDTSAHKVPGDPEALQLYIDSGCPLQPTEGDSCDKAYVVIECYHRHADLFFFP